MQFADLMTLFREGQNEGRKRGYVMQGSCDAEGIRFVLRALHGKFLTMEFGDQYEVGEMFRAILASEGEEALALRAAGDGR